MLLKHVIDFILPVRCRTCGVHSETDAPLCSTCWSKIQFITEPACERCGAPLHFIGAECISCPSFDPSWDRVYAATVYNDCSKKLILRFKHGGCTELSALFGQWITYRLPHDLIIDHIIPVPLHRWRLMWRGYNQATLLSKQINPALVNTSILKRHRYTHSMGTLTFNKRLKNLKDAFIAHTDLVQKKHILLIDDVLTSGATLNACAHTLKQAGALSVTCAVLSRAILNHN